MKSILWVPDNYTEIIEISCPFITTGSEDKGNGVYLLRAGTPLSSGYAVANSSSARYVVAEDSYFYAAQPNQVRLVRLIKSGYVDLAAAQAAYGASYESAAKSALKTAGIILVDGKLTPDAVGVTPYTLPAATDAALGGVKLAANQADSTADSLAGLVTDFNSLLDKLQTAGVMAPAAEEVAGT